MQEAANEALKKLEVAHATEMAEKQERARKDYGLIEDHMHSELSALCEQEKQVMSTFTRIFQHFEYLIVVYTLSESYD